MQIDTRALVPKIEDLILDAALAAIPGEQKLKQVVDAAAKWLAKQTPGVPDVIEVPIYRAILWLPVQMVYDRLRDAGKV